MLRIHLASSPSELPDWLDADAREEVEEELQDGDSYDDRSVLLLDLGDGLETHTDCGEPEDNRFTRDWSWVPNAIERAYKLGQRETGIDTLKVHEALVRAGVHANQRSSLSDGVDKLNERVAALSAASDELAQFLLKEFPDEPGRGGRNEGAIDCALRLLGDYKRRLDLLAASSAKRQLEADVLAVTPEQVNNPEPPPQVNDSRPVWELVIEDMQERDRVGRAKYGTPLQTFNGRRPLVDAYQEILDLAVYLRQEIAERAELDRQVSEARTMIDKASRQRRLDQDDAERVSEAVRFVVPMLKEES